jgi:hypothetical protein
MKTIIYKITYTNGDDEYIYVLTKDINAGFSKALKKAMEPLGNGKRREISGLMFWEVK